MTTEPEKASQPPLSALVRLGASVRAALNRRLNRLSFLGEFLVYCLAIAVVVMPMATVLWTSPVMVRQLYVLVAVPILLLCAGGIVYSYMGRLQDQGIPGLWAPVILFVVPFALTWGAWSYGNSQALAALKANHPPAAQISDYENVAAILALLVVVAFAARPSRSDPWPPRRPTFAILVAACCVAAVAGYAIYAGLFQDGIWVRQGDFPSFVALGDAAEGTVLATCANAKGVSAANQQDAEGSGGFNRDAIPGLWNLVLLPDGTWDIQTSSATQQVSYRRQGFAVDVRPSAPVQQTRGFPEFAATADRIVILAHTIGPVELGPTANVTAITLTKLDDFNWRAIISSSSTLSARWLPTVGSHPRSTSYMMVADCNVRHAYKP